MMTRKDFIDDCFKGDELAAREFEQALLTKGDELPSYVRRVQTGEIKADSRYYQFLIDQYESGEIVDHRGSLITLAKPAEVKTIGDALDYWVEITIKANVLMDIRNALLDAERQDLHDALVQSVSDSGTCEAYR